MRAGRNTRTTGGSRPQVVSVVASVETASTSPPPHSFSVLRGYFSVVNISRRFISRLENLSLRPSRSIIG